MPASGVARVMSSAAVWASFVVGAGYGLGGCGRAHYQPGEPLPDGARAHRMRDGAPDASDALDDAVDGPSDADGAPPSDSGADADAAPLAPPAAGTALWGRAFGGAADERTQAVAIDGTGHVVAAGFFESVTDFGGGGATPAGGRAAFLARFDGGGDLVWMRQIRASGGSIAHGVATQPSGDVVVTGWSIGLITVEGDDTPGAGGRDAFVVSFDRDGAPSWVRRFGSTGEDEGAAVAVDETGRVLVAGSFEGTVDFGDGPATAAGGADVFVVCLTSSGDVVWHREFGGALTDVATSIAVGRDGRVAVAGRFATAIDLGATSLASAGGVGDAFLVALEPAGAPRWAHRLGGTEDDEAHGVAIDAVGNVYWAGVFEGDATHEDGDLPGAGGLEGFILSVTADGEPRWVKRVGARDNDVVGDLALDGHGNLAVVGQFQASVDFGGGGAPSSGIDDVFVLFLDPLGAFRWVRTYSGDGRDFGLAVAAGLDGNVAAGGFYGGMADFGSGPRASLGAGDAFVLLLE